MNIWDKRVKEIPDLKDMVWRDFNDMKKFYFRVLCESPHFRPYSYDLREIKDEHRTSFVVRENKDIIAHLTFYNDERNPNIFIIGFAVLKEHYSKGLGSKMMEFGEDYIKKMGGDTIVGNIYKDNWRSILLMTKRGYRIISDVGMIRVEKKI